MSCRCLCLVIAALACTIEVVLGFHLVRQKSPLLRDKLKDRTFCRACKSSVIESQGDGEIFPYCVAVPQASDGDDSSSWIQEAARNLKDHGACVLLTNTIANDNDYSRVCRDANAAAISRLTTLQNRIARSEDGLDPRESQFRFMEVVSRDPGGRRYDMPVSWKSRKQMGLRMTDIESKVISTFHERVEEKVKPIMSMLWEDDDLSPSVTASGFLINQAGSSDQNWHRDGPNEGFIDVFVPLMDLSMDLGPTEVWANTHLLSDDEAMADSSNRVAPLLKRGHILLMDYRTYHRGLGNISGNTTRTVAYTVYHKGASSLGDKLSYGLLPRAYQSICAADNEAKGAPQFRVSVFLEGIDEWAEMAASLIRETGVCVLCRTEEDGVLDEAICRNAKEAVASRFLELQRRIENRGMDPSGEEDSFRFLEVQCKDDSGRRYELPVTWKNRRDTGTPLSSLESHVVIDLHSQMECVLEPVMKQLWGDESYHIAASGFLLDKPGSTLYPWDRDCCAEGSVYVLCPMVDLTKEMGPVEVWPYSHSPTAALEEDADKMDPMLKQGQMLLMDCRTLRQHLPNAPKDTKQTKTVAYAMIRKGARRGNLQTAAGGLTLEYD